MDESRQVGLTVNQLRERTLTTRQADHALMEAGRRRLLPWSHIGQVQAEYTEPRHKELKGNTAWNLYNAFSEIAKKSNPVRQIRAMDRFREIVLN